jgi:hypothetical protein
VRGSCSSVLVRLRRERAVGLRRPISPSAVLEHVPRPTRPPAAGSPSRRRGSSPGVRGSPSNPWRWPSPGGRGQTPGPGHELLPGGRVLRHVPRDERHPMRRKKLLRQLAGLSGRGPKHTVRMSSMRCSSVGSSHPAVGPTCLCRAGRRGSVARRQRADPGSARAAALPSRTPHSRPSRARARDRALPRPPPDRRDGRRRSSRSGSSGGMMPSLTLRLLPMQRLRSESENSRGLPRANRHQDPAARCRRSRRDGAR